MTTKIPVLIVGAGPSGLTMAAALYQQGIEYQIIDKLSSPITTSNAAVIHSRTLELLDHLNLVDPFIKHGQRIHAIALYQKSKQFATLETSLIQSHYNYLLSIPQNKTERILNDYLSKIGTPVKRNCNLMKIHSDRHQLIATLTDPDGSTREVQCDYLIACDGLGSTVRSQLNLQLTGHRLTQQFIIADTRIQESYPDDICSIYLDPDGPLGIFPFKKKYARIVASLNDPERPLKQPISFLEIQHLLSKRSGEQIQIEELYWVSPFWIQSKKLNTFRAGRIFFVGDCAHVHSPVGAQGMNTGMQDAYNLAWKLSLEIKGSASNRLLNSYDEEREENARLLLTRTDQLTSLVLIRNPLLQMLRFLIIKFLMKKKFVRHFFMKEMSMLNIHYKKSSVIDYSHPTSSSLLVPGHRIPDCSFHTPQGKKRLHELLRTPKHALLLFTPKDLTRPEGDQLRALEEWTKPLSSLIQCVLISPFPLSHLSSFQQITDLRGELHRALSIRTACFFIIRPDQYIGCCSTQLNVQTVKSYFLRVFNTPS